MTSSKSPAYMSDLTIPEQGDGTAGTSRNSQETLCRALRSVTAKMNSRKLAVNSNVCPAINIFLCSCDYVKKSRGGPQTEGRMAGIPRLLGRLCPLPRNLIL